LQFGSNFLGPFALTVRLLPLLLAAAEPRVATMTSGAASFGMIRFDDLHWTRRYRPYAAYAQSKLADLMLTLRLADIADERGWTLLSTAGEPGYTRTNILNAGPSLGRDKPARTMHTRFLKILPSQDVEHGAEPLLHAATSPDAVQGGYYAPSGPLRLVGPTAKFRPARRALDKAAQKRLWGEAEHLTGVALKTVLS
jgi:NAD(P)-dependent dehydrogenase (short-subunit alcohol dehydrogenase family)